MRVSLGSLRRSMRTVPAAAALVWWFSQALLLSTTGCEKPNEYVAPPPPTVTVATPQTRAVTNYMEYTGTLTAEATVEIRARVAGFLQEMNFKEGALIEKGALLFKIDPKEYEAKLAQARAAVDMGKAGLALGEAKLSRMEQAAKTDAVSQLEVLQAEAERDTAKAQLAAAEAQLVQADLDLSYTEIHSPMTGRVGKRLVDVGNLVGSGENTLLTTIVSYDPIYADFDVSERDLLQLMNEKRAGGSEPDPDQRLRAFRAVPLELGLSNEKGYPHLGHMFYADQEVDSATGTLLLRGIFKNPQPIRLWPGLFVRVRTALSERADAVLVPERAVGADQSGRYVLVVNPENKVERRNVEAGAKYEDMLVIESGLEATDRVVVEGILRARPGAKVTPREAEKAPAASKAPAPQAGD